MKNNEDSFYIGWQDHAPAPEQHTIQRFIAIVSLVLVASAAALVASQRGFADGTFELGRLSTIQGVMAMEPVPMLKVPTNNPAKPFESVLLIGFGKYRATPTLEAMEAAAGTTLAGKTVTFQGTAIYYQDKRAFELTEGADALLGIEEQNIAYTNRKKGLGQVSLRGEILDPKCALGVMKPGYGKPHRSCAVRCISGGIPPIFRTVNEDGGIDYCILRGPDGGMINSALLDYVADQVQLCGQLEQEDDWLVLYTNPEEDLYRIKPSWMQGEVPTCASR
ncbi:MAG: hypothetical protein KI786_03875 [Mameliella sp.]|nr:hypothetical protein [Phaeodactylibacter sp.]